ncbi:MAG: hypothetical protein KGI37_07920 [Alphaproteobacteria bacterium]|nr:hypothetical protein [Alphaproteobacteria bacterium]
MKKKFKNAAAQSLTDIRIRSALFSTHTYRLDVPITGKKLVVDYYAFRGSQDVEPVMMEQHYAAETYQQDYTYAVMPLMGGHEQRFKIVLLKHSTVPPNSAYRFPNGCQSLSEQFVQRNQETGKPTFTLHEAIAFLRGIEVKDAKTGFRLNTPLLTEAVLIQENTDKHWQARTGNGRGRNRGATVFVMETAKRAPMSGAYRTMVPA